MRNEICEDRSKEPGSVSRLFAITLTVRMTAVIATMKYNAQMTANPLLQIEVMNIVPISMPWWHSHISGPFGCWKEVRTQYAPTLADDHV